MQISAVTRRLTCAVVIVGGILCAGVRLYSAYQARRAESMLGEASRVRIGDSEASVLSLVRRYHGHKWSPSGSTRATLGPRENWVDLEMYDRALRIYPDYEYSIEVNPWGFPTFEPSSKAAKALRTVINAIPSGVRSPIGLRDWASFVDVRIRDGRVSEVEGIVFVEGRSRWLNHSWSLANERLRESLPLRPYTIESENVLMRDGRSRGICNLITSQASEEQAEAAHSWNAGCIVSLRSCRNICELSPRAYQYWKNEPGPAAAAWGLTCK